MSQIENNEQNTQERIIPKLRFPEFQTMLGWKNKKFKDISPLQRGFDLPSSELKEGEIPVVYSNGVQNFHNKGMAIAPAVITGRSGTIGKIHYIESGEYWPHNTTLWVTGFMNNVPKFVYYLFENINIKNFSSGSGVPTLNRNDIHNSIAAVPLLPKEQQKIADCLSSIDELIELEEQAIAGLKQHKKGLMQKLFPTVG